MKKMNNKMRTLLPALLLIALFACHKEKKETVPVAEVKFGTFFLDIFEEGEIKATKSTNISSPNISWRYGSLKITQLVNDGKEIQQGDTVIVFDPSEVKKAIVESEGVVEMRKAEFEKLKAEHQLAMEELKADLEVTKISQEISKIQFESANYEAEIKKKEIELNLEKANIALQRAKEQIENRDKFQQEEIKQKLLSIRQSENELRDANQTLEKMFIVSSTPGIAIINYNWSSNAKFQIGDQCWSGFPLIELPDLSEMKAIVQVNEVDISKIVKGLRVEIKPDAFSDSVYEGEVVAVANLAVNKVRDSKIKVFPVDILIKGTQANLLPGLTVSCRIIIDQIDNVIFVPVDAVKTSAEGDFVFVKKATGFEQRMVGTGQRNTDMVIITKGLKANDQVALVDPFAQEIKEENSNKKQSKNE
jgi:multidrug efflux pump subunit AcrA (membrane-fusion protein)